MIYLEDTICACATGHGGAISVIRLSGAGALDILDKVVQFKRGRAAEFKGYSVHFGTIQDIDDVLVSVFRAPHSYTAEDGAEISCHASEYIVSQILQRLIDAGARMAEPGEFTRRAFLAGKMDLSQAEAVADVIAADSKAAHRVAMNQLRGGYSAELRALRASLLELCALMELELDFSEEDVEFADRTRLSELLSRVTDKVSALCDSFRLGNAIKNGIPVAIAGAPNSGKSTLLNALLGEERAIVSDIAGTTRDTVEESIVLGGVRFRFIDTAGIRQTEDVIEALGVQRSLDALDRAQIVLAVLDGCIGISEQQDSLDSILERSANANVLVLLNKADVASGAAAEAGGIDPRGNNVLQISARTGAGLDELRAQLVSLAGAAADPSATLVTNARHYAALRESLAALDATRDALALGVPTDLLSEHLRSAISSLGSITGEISTDEVLGEIFSKFCIGK